MWWSVLVMTCILVVVCVLLAAAIVEMIWPYEKGMRE